MTRRGRKPLGPELVEHLLGSEHAKGRLKVLLETLREEKSVPEACRALSLGESRFHELRVDTLQAALCRLWMTPIISFPLIVSRLPTRIIGHVG